MTKRHLMRTTDNPILYAYAHPEVRRLLLRLDAGGPIPYETARGELDIDAQKFHRITRRLTHFGLIWLEAADGARWENRRIRVQLRITPGGARFLAGLKRLDAAMLDHADLLGGRVVESLQVGT